MSSGLSSHPPFLTIDPPASPFNPPFDLSPPSSPSSTYSADHDSISPLTPEPGSSFPAQNDTSRVSSFIQAAGFNFGLSNTNNTSPVRERQGSDQSTSNLLPPRPAAVPPGGVYRERDEEAGVEAPPPYERYARHTMPAGGFHQSRASITAGQFPSTPAFPIPAYGRGRHHRFASVASISSTPRRFSGQRQLRSLTLSDMRTSGIVSAQARRSAKQASWGFFGGSKEGANEKRPLTRKGKWCIYIAALTVLITITLVGALVGTLRPRDDDSQSDIDVSDFPKLPVGLVEITPQGDPLTPPSACVVPKTLWSCSLPSDTLFPTVGGANRLPKFIFTITVRNSSWGQNPIGPLSPFPAPVPTDSEYVDLAGVDGIQASDKSGEQTPFYLSMQTDPRPIPIPVYGESPADMEFITTPETLRESNSRRHRKPKAKRQDAAAATAAATAAAVQYPALMLPGTVMNQPLRLFDRGLDTEHYGFFIYYKKTILVMKPDASSSSSSSNGTVAADANGGVSALVSNSQEVTWENTRFRVAIWTKMRASGQMDLIGDQGQRLSSQIGAFDKSFPYPVSVVEDRNGKKGQVWYGKRFQPRKIVQEEKGEVCSCEWRNWRAGSN